MAFDANAYVSDLSMAELNDILYYGPNLATYDERSAAKAAARARLNELQAEAAQGGAGTSGGLTEGGGTWDGIYADGSSMPGYGGDVGRGTNEIPIPEDATPPLSGGPGIQDPSAPGITDWGGANIRQPADPFAPPQAPVSPPPSNGMGPGGGQIQAPQGPQPPVQGGDPFAPQGSGAIDSFLPGSRNDQFYTDQFNQLAAQNQAFQAQQAQANAMRQNPNQPGMWPDDPFDWLEGGLPDRSTPEAPAPTTPAPVWPGYGDYTPIYGGGGAGSIIQGGNKPL